MPRPKRRIGSETIIDGSRLIWHLHREQQWCTADGWKGVAIHVKAVEGTYRELYLEYPPTKTQKTDWARIEPIKQTISPNRVELHIRQAMADGWNPVSRGRPYVYEVAELPG